MLFTACSPTVAERLDDGTGGIIVPRSVETSPSFAQRSAGQPRPAAPLNIVATKTGRGAARVTWTAPASPGFSYVVRVGAAETEVTGLEASFAQLPTASPLTFFVRALTAFGPSDEAASNAVVLADVPGAPVDVQAAPARDSAYLTWIPPENGGAPILEYELVAQATGAVTRAPGKQSAARLAGLSSGQSQTVLVRAKNLAGTGPAAPVQLTPQCVRGFVNPPMADFVSDSRSAGVADLNGDGIVDAWGSDGTGGVALVYFTDRGTIARIEQPGIPVSGLGLGDFDEDGNLDVVSHGRDLDVHLARGGAQRFTTVRLLAAASSMETVNGALVADWNGDHHLDVITNYLSSDRIFLGQGDGSFTELTMPVVAGAYRVGDFDGDGKASILALRSLGELSVLDLRDGGVSENQLSVGRWWMELFVADVEPDGDDDLVFTFPSETEVWRSVAGTPQYAATIVGFQTIIVADATGDGLVDLVGRDGRVLANAGDAGFEATAPLAQSETWEVVGAADLDRDGLPDAIMVTENGIGVALGRFRSQLLPGPFANNTVPFGAAIADFDSDGRPDLVEASGHPTRTLSLWRGLDHDGGWSLRTEVTQFSSLYHALEIGDLNGDGLPDLVLSNDPAAEVFMNDAGVLVFDRLLAGSRAVIGDYDGDGIADVLAGGFLHRGQPGGLSVGVLVGGPVLHPQSMIAGADLIGDRAAELIGFDGVWSLTDAGFQRGPPVRVTKVADLNGDGLADGIYLGNSGSPAYASPDVWLQRPDGGFELRACVPPPTGWMTHKLNEGSLADLDADGDLDLVAVQASSWATIVVFWNDGDGGFTKKNRYRSGWGRTDVATVDVDGDGATEFVASAAYGAPVFHPNVCVE